MYEAASLASIRNRMSKELPREVVVTRREPVPEFGYMTPQAINSPTRYQTVRSTEKRQSKLVGILLCHPNSPLAKSEILGHLPQFHIRSGEAIDFFCAGYGAYWPPNHHVDQNVVARINKEDWLFSNEAFNQVIEELERESKWEFSGETELLLIPVSKSSDGGVTFQYQDSIVCNLEAMAKDDAFTSVRAFFELIFRFAKSKSAEDSTWEFSDKLGMGVAGNMLKDFIISLLPKPLQSGYKKASHYAVKNIAVDF
jgi:hypothetical protein